MAVDDVSPNRFFLRDLLTHDGSIWVSIDDKEAHYLKVLMDEVFGRNCFVADIAWKRRDGAPNDRKKIGATYDHIFVFRQVQYRLVKEDHCGGGIQPHAKDR
ncbi:DNA methyltransferase [Undibacterium arcticum]